MTQSSWMPDGAPVRTFPFSVTEYSKASSCTRVWCKAFSDAELGFRSRSYTAYDARGCPVASGLPTRRAEGPRKRTERLGHLPAEGEAKLARRAGRDSLTCPRPRALMSRIEETP
jgi:hypothetical protein